MYRLLDEYSIFYYQFAPQKNTAGIFIKISNSSKYSSWAGFAKKARSIAGIFLQESSCNFKGNKQQPGFQTETLIDRSDNSINICEMKFHATAFELFKNEAAN